MSTSRSASASGRHVSLPSPVLAAETAAFRYSAPRVFVAASHVYHVAGALAQRVGDMELSWVATDRAVATAERGEDTQLLAVAARRVANALLRSACRTLATGARRGYERALAIDEATYGPDHAPSVGRDVGRLAGVLRDLGDLEGARQGFERALAIITTAWGPDHPRAVTVAQNLKSLD